MKIFISPTSFMKNANKKARQRAEDFFDIVSYNDLGVPLSGTNLLERLDGCDAYIAGLDYITAEIIAQMPESLKVISRYGAGLDRVDLDACRKRGIIVTNTPGANARAVSELSLGLMLSVARSIPQLNEAVRNNKWPRADGMELSGKTLGILGLGAIGKKVAIKALSFDMNIVVHDPYLDREFVRHHNLRDAGLDEIFELSNIISLHLPLTEETRHLVNERRMRLMKPDGIIINTSRGGLIDEKAAIKLLKEGYLRGMGLDAFEEEPLVNSEFQTMQNVVLTPHTGAHTSEAVASMGLISVENAIAIVKNEPCDNVVT